jgi:dolichol-phosphate mannosyltransferase
VRNCVLRSTDWARFTTDGYGFIIEFHFHAWRSGFRIAEVPIVFTERRAGASKMSLKIMAESAIRVCSLGIYRLFHRRRKTAAAVESPNFA